MPGRYPLGRGLEVLSAFASGGVLDYPVIGYDLQRAIPSARGPFITPSPRHGDEKHGNVNPFLVGVPLRVSLRGRLTPG